MQSKVNWTVMLLHTCRTGSLFSAFPYNIVHTMQDAQITALVSGAITG